MPTDYSFVLPVGVVLLTLGLVYAVWRAYRFLRADLRGLLPRLLFATAACTGGMLYCGLIALLLTTSWDMADCWQDALVPVFGWSYCVLGMGAILGWAVVLPLALGRWLWGCFHR